MRKLLTVLILVVLFVAYPNMLYAQNWGQILGNALVNGANQAVQIMKTDRSMIRNTLSNNSGCSAAALTVDQGAVIIVGGNGYQYSSGVPQGFRNDVDQVRNAGKSIKDICITEGGKWSILTVDNYVYGNTPQSVRDAIPRMYQPKSLSFNDGGEYVAVLSDGTILTNVQAYTDFYEEHKNDYGTLLSINVYSLGSVWCYSSHTTYCGNIPQYVANAINSLSFRPRFVKYNNHGDYVAYNTTGSYYYDIADTDARSYATTVSNWATPKQPVNSGYGYGGADVYVPSSVGVDFGGGSSSSSSNSSSGYQRQEQRCTLCHGTGNCFHCHGSGKDHATYGNATYRCGDCNGTGQCRSCGGRGVR